MECTPGRPSGSPLWPTARSVSMVCTMMGGAMSVPQRVFRA